MSESGDGDILLVEDNVTDMELTVRALRRHHIANRVDVVRDGAEALDFVFGRGKYASRKPEEGLRLILLDLKLPKVHGLEVLRQIKSNPGSKTIPVVVLTSSHEDRDLVESYRLGVNSYIVKPVDFLQFSDAIRQLGLYWLLLNQSCELPCRVE